MLVFPLGSGPSRHPCPPLGPQALRFRDLRHPPGYSVLWVDRRWTAVTEEQGVGPSPTSSSYQPDSRRPVMDTLCPLVFSPVKWVQYCVRGP